MAPSNAFWLSALMLAPVLAAGDESAPPAARRELRDTFGVAANNLGVQNVLELSTRRRLGSSSRPLWRDAHVSAGLTHSVTPAYTRLGAWAELAPLSIVSIRAGIEPALYFGTFGSLMSFQDYRDDFGNDARKARRDTARPGSAARAYLAPEVRLKAGPVIAVAGAELEWWRSSASGPLFYEPARDTLLKTAGGRMASTAAALLYELDRARGGTLRLGISHRLTYVYDAPANRVQRVGALVVREFAGRRFGLNRPAVVANLSYYLDDPFKRHQIGAAAALAFAVTR